MFRKPLIIAFVVGVVPFAIRATAGEADLTAKASADSLQFVMHRVGSFRSEACCVGDFNHDGKLDVVAGPFLYLASDWKPVAIRKLKGAVDAQGKGYYQDFMNIAYDVDGDGWLDVVSCSWDDRCASWFRNPGPVAGQLWQETLIEKNGPFEGGDLWDVDGDGKAMEIVPSVRHTMWYESGKLKDGKPGFLSHVVCKRELPHFGVGVGDVNNDGRPDILRPDAWYEAPANPRDGEWIEHPLSLCGKEGTAEDAAQIWCYDVNGDGLNDILCGSAHKQGIFWYERIGKGADIRWKQHVIDDSWTQAHAVVLVDLDNDGVPELIAGKRFMAHNGNDPDEFGPLGIYYYKLQRGPTPAWTKHAIVFDKGIGVGGNIVVEDLDGDGDRDLVVTGKYGGPVWFENKLK
jgi:hypothetical protein